MTIRIYEKWSGWLQIRQGLDNFIVFYIYFYCNSSADMSELCSLMGETHRWNYIFRFNLSDIQAWQYPVVNSVQGNFKT